MQGDKTSQTVNTGSQTAKHDEGKAQLSLVPTKITYAIARIREYGTKKYGDPDNWMQVEPQRYRDAMYRHMLAYIEDPHGVDEESGLPHLWHLACNVAFLCELDDAKRLTVKERSSLMFKAFHGATEEELFEMFGLCRMTPPAEQAKEGDELHGIHTVQQGSGPEKAGAAERICNRAGGCEAARADAEAGNQYRLKF